ncbi:MAG: glycosyltransferase [Lentisphaerae bacterium]|jgi:glycosyltransferase XagB|nr:glycosyltransferase [Lentisphaerota bacterium]MBT4820704.1 glycosyltransferase [Lentisphaerota bacterium]MBT5604470.1 glycosyltransferase [Lentisphaerota bacterium]MBT7060471.1 glycosyltransferase [Lentisphaerota bacterium]MBT7844378.1 glycosyltransferase [Lentisphaerota bacterium]
MVSTAQQSPKATRRDRYSPRGFPQAVETLVPWQRVAMVLIILGLLAAAVVDFRTELLVLNIVCSIFYLASSLYRVLMIDLSLRHEREVTISKEEIGEWTGGWPSYLIQIPMYHEGDVLPTLVKGLSQLDYPKDRLEIRLLIEEDDPETMDVAQALDLKPPFVIYPIPVSHPRTKPKACNVALANTDADFLVIFDAEDRPEKDQLKKAVLAFTKSPVKVACIQAKLNFYNPDQNFLTRCFTAEYATWFDLCLPGLDCLKAPIPLGGTSNHFKLDVLKHLGGWDEFNVTEDCDLGLRLFAAGWQTRVLDSTTWEQACPSVPFWISQRSRWVKGYMQTYLVHMRSPWSLFRRIGLWNFIQFQLLIGGTPLCQLISPFYWLLALLWLILQPVGLEVYFPGPIFAIGAVCLFAGNFIFAYTSGIACVRRGFGHLAKYGLAMPAYWVLLSIGAWKGFLQLLTRPHHWEKTKHFSNEAQGLEATMTEDA